VTDPEPLSAAEKAAADMFGMPHDEYANFKQVHPKLPDPQDAERERLKSAIREVLNERDGAL